MADQTDRLVAKYDDLARIASQLSRLTDTITTNARAYPDATVDWKAFRQKLMVVNEGIAERRFRLAFAGGFSVGKSYLVSLFLGRPGLLPSYNKPTTGVVSGIRKGTRPTMEVHYWTRSDSDDMQRYYLDQLGIPQSVPIGDGPKAVEALRPKLPPQKQNMVTSYFNLLAAHEKYASKLGTTQEVVYNPIQPEHAGNPEKYVDRYPHIQYIIKLDNPEPNQPLLRTIKQVVLYVDSEYLTDTVEVVDLPGAGAFDPIDTYIQHYFLRKTDGVTVVTNIKRPFDEQESVVVDILKANQDELKGRAFIAMTMFDTLAGPELDPERLLLEFRSIQSNVLQGRIQLPDAPLFYVSPFITSLVEKVQRGEKLSDKESPYYELYQKQSFGKTNDARLDALLEAYRRAGGLPDMRRRLLEHFRGEMVRLKLASITKGLASLSRELEGSFKPRWEKAVKEGGKAEQLKIVGAIKYVSRLRDGFAEKSNKFRKESILKKPFDKVFEQVTQRMAERIKLHLAQCTEAELKKEFETMGGGREPKELLRLFREHAQAAIVDDFSRLIWDRAGDNRVAHDGQPAPIPQDTLGLLKKHIRDGYYVASGKEELVGAVNALLPNNPDERNAFKRIFDELELCLEITTDNFVTRETLDLNEPVDSLAQGAAGFPDWAKRYQSGLTQVLTEKLQRYAKNMQGYLWNLYWKHISSAETKVGAFLESEDLLGLVTVNIDDIQLKADGKTGVFSPKVILEHFTEWKKVDAAITNFEHELG
ncbi:hypothetical protein HY251_19735 [bacterium]|nr:hypothetical protein [bacterium]